jgi:mono/diheme cytochrome c family protein
MKSNRKWMLLAFGAVALSASAACRQDMHNQPKYRPLRASTFFADGSSARPLVEGTVARGLLHADEAFYTGMTNGAAIREMPLPVDAVLVARGRERYDVFCAPCHGGTGDGDGMIVQRGYRRPPSMHEERLREVGVGHFFDVMTNGFGAMPDYRQQVSPRDRWAIVAYVRALQLTQPVAPPLRPEVPDAAQPVPGGPPAPGGQPGPGGQGQGR